MEDTQVFGLSTWKDRVCHQLRWETGRPGETSEADLLA